MTAVLETMSSRSLFDDLIDIGERDEPSVGVVARRRGGRRTAGWSFTRELRQIVGGAIVTVLVATVALVALAGVDDHGARRDRGPVASQVAGSAGTSALARW